MLISKKWNSAIKGITLGLTILVFSSGVSVFSVNFEDKTKNDIKFPLSVKVEYTKAYAKDKNKTQWEKASALLKEKSENVSYQINVSSGKSKLSYKYYYKGKKIKAIMSKAMETYMDIEKGKSYSYIPKTKMAISSKISGLESIFEYQKYINVSYTGTKKVDSMECDAYEITEESLPDDSMKKLWKTLGIKRNVIYISKATGFFVRQESISKKASVISTFCDVVFGKVTDTDVSLPKGTKIY